MTEIINANNKGFVVVSIQYRVRSLPGLVLPSNAPLLTHL